MSSHWLLHASSGEFWPVADPIVWCLANADHPILARAQARLRTLTEEDRTRIIRLVTRRCDLSFIEIEQAQVVVHFWCGPPDLRHFFKELCLARESVKVFLCERKRERISVRNGADFMYGELLTEEFPVNLYRTKHENVNVVEANDHQPAPWSWTSYSWNRQQPTGVPWAILKAIWQREQALICGNCDVPLLTISFGFWYTFLNCYSRIVRVCLGCRRRFQFDNENVIAILDNLDDALLPSFEKRRGRIVKWSSKKSN